MDRFEAMSMLVTVFQAYEQGNFHHGDFSFLKLNYERETLTVISIPAKWQD